MPFQFTCRQCDAAFTHDERGRSFCSRDCYLQWRWGPPVSFTCEVCGNIFSKHHKRTYNGRRPRFCSYVCSHKGQAHPGMHVHGMKHTPEYEIWHGLKQRCLNANSPNFSSYGGRGITVCDRWRDDFAAFYADMGPRPSPELSLDRYPDNDGPYAPDNCRWATASEQARNRRPRKRAL